MVHPRVEQLRFTRSELVRALAGVSDADARRRVLPMNSIEFTRDESVPRLDWLCPLWQCETVIPLGW